MKKDLSVQISAHMLFPKYPYSFGEDVYIKIEVWLFTSYFGCINICLQFENIGSSELPKGSRIVSKTIVNLYKHC